MDERTARPQSRPPRREGPRPEPSGPAHPHQEHREHQEHGAHDSPPDLLADGPECQEALDTLYHFLDGELTDERRHQIQHHLDECSPCLEAFDFEAELKVVIARRCKDVVPEVLRMRIAIALEDASISLPGPEEGAHTHPQPDHHW